MSASKGSFQAEYKIIEVIKARKDKKTCIVQNSIGEYYIAKKFYASDIYALNEIGLMKTIRHPNIVGFHDIIMEKGRIYLIEEYCEEGDLGYHIRRQIKKKRSYFSEKVIAKWLLQLLLAIEYLHNKKIMHRDIRPQNIFLTSLGNLKLGSFRSSKMYASECQLSATVIGSPYYMAPECMEARGYDEKVDIWAFGCLMYEICSLKSVFSDKNIVQQAEIVLRGNNREIPPIYSKELVDIYNKCLTKKASQRPSAKSLIREPYFLEQMKKFVTQKPEPILRIPIKHYNVHFNVLAHKKSEKDANELRKTLRQKKFVQEEPRIHAPVLPKIEEINKNEERKRRSSKSFQKAKLKEEEPRSVRITKQNSIEKVREALRQRSKQMVRQNSKERQRSKELVRKKSSNKLEKYVVSSPNQAKKMKDSQGSERRSSAEKGHKIQKTKTEVNTDSPNPKSLLLPPPMLPRPPPRKTQRKQSQKTMAQSNKSQPMTFSDTKRKEQLAYELANLKHQGENPFNKDEIKSSLTKIFDDLNIRQDDQEQFSFEIEDENLARLTIKRNEGNELLETYKSKFEQLVEEINYKYCPLLQPIQERTQEFDSNTFASIRKP